MNFELFNQLYIEALEESDLECYIAERGCKSGWSHTTLKRLQIF